MNDYKHTQLAPSVLEACSKLRVLLSEIEDINLDAVCQTELGTRDYDGQPDAANIYKFSCKLKEIWVLTQNLIELTTYTERRAIEAQGLLPWRFDQ